ncbi:MAG: LysR family transcriptional regulator [Novosphingobium sp.]
MAVCCLSGYRHSVVQFIAVAEHLNFRDAPKALGVSQSSVSTPVKALKIAMLSCCCAPCASVRLTDAGRFFMKHVTASVDQTRSVRPAVSSVASNQNLPIAKGETEVRQGAF